MAKKKSCKKPANRFISECESIKEFIRKTVERKDFSDEHVTWAHDYAVMRLYREFEQMILECIIAGLNQNTGEFSKSQGFDFPKNLTDEVCEYLILGGGYFDFKGPKDIRRKSKKFLGDKHFLTVVFFDNYFEAPMKQLLALRNFAAHDSAHSKREALSSVGLTNMKSAGSYLKKQGRMNKLIDSVAEIARRIEFHAPF